MEIAKKIGMQLLAALMTEKFIKSIVIYLLKKLAEKSDNKIDDEVVKLIEQALNPEQPKPAS